MSTEYCWEEADCAEVEWTFFEDGTGVDEFDNEALWRLQRGNLRWEYTGTRTTYFGSFADECIIGEMRRLDGDLGTFTACRE
jgi:hypothetical protein